ncbi:MAG: efflux RND transporter periplasmic adaptor subunit [Gammaproteobacteria bacterium]|nr:efflux RND transporter periplasmic adaptor subunit [Gammaproteobacteria bacterium]
MHQITSVLPLLFVLILVSACDQQSPAPKAESNPSGTAQVRILVLQPQDWQQTIQVYGVVEATEDVAVSVDFSGTVTKVYFKETQRVSQGELLVELDNTKQGLRVDRARSGAEATKAALEEARRTLSRRRNLEAKAAVSKELLESSEIAVRQAAATYEDALAGLALAERELAESRVLSPVDGLVEKRAVEPGETVLPGHELARIQAVDVVRILTFVSERDVNFLRSGTVALVTSPGVPGRSFEAMIESIGVQADPRTGNFSIKLTLPNADGLLRPGMTARVQFQGFREQGRLLIPEKALVDRNRRKVVYLALAGKAREVEPVLRATTGDRLPVIDGLSPGDQLIVSGLEYLIDGSPIEITGSNEP